MNECFLFVKRTSNIEYKFIINRKEKSIARFKATLLNNAQIVLYAYDELADFLYQKEPEILFIIGKLRENMEIEIMEIYK